jgi:hypothetical protein
MAACHGGSARYRPSMTFLPLMAVLAAPSPVPAQALIAQVQEPRPQRILTLPSLPPLPGSPLPSQPLQDPWSRLPRELQTGPAVPRSLQVDSYDGPTL